MQYNSNNNDDDNDYHHHDYDNVKRQYIKREEHIQVLDGYRDRDPSKASSHIINLVARFQFGRSISIIDRIASIHT